MISKTISIRMAQLIALAAMACSASSSLAQKVPPPGRSPVSVNVMDRTRTVANDWYKAPPYTSTYPYVEQLLRFSVAQKLKHFDWMLEGSQNDVFDVPTTAVSAVAAQGQLGLGGTYWAANGNNTLPAAVSFRQGFLRLHGAGPDTTLRAGRFEFFDGQETVPKDSTLAWLQTNRIAQRLIGNFGFSNGQRSFDGVDGHLGNANWDLTAMAGRATQGVFNMNANPELNVDVQYLAYSRYAAGHHVLLRAFGIGYHDGRTGLVKTDNRALGVRQTDHKNIRIGTYGADAIAAIPAGAGTFDLLFWGVLQNGNWGVQDQRSGAAAVEGGFRLTGVATKPWLRGGWFRSTGDTSATDTQHGTFFQILPTPRIYARFPFFNLMNDTDEFAQVVDDPTKKIQARADLHWVKLTSSQDVWYGGGGAYDNLVFGYTGRPANGHNGLATWTDISMDYQVTPSFALNTYYAHSMGKAVVAAIYPAGKTANYGYLELVYKWGIKQSAPAKK